MGLFDGILDSATKIITGGSWIGPAISGTLAYLSQDDTNNANQQIAANNSAFNAEEAQKARAFNAEQAGIARNYNSAEAVAQRTWEENMSNTAWQRGTADMQAAGINPMLAFMKGGASTPSGATAAISGASGPSAQGVSYQRQNPALAAIQASQAAMTTANQAADIKLKEAQADATTAQAEATRGRLEWDTGDQAKVIRQANIDETYRRIEKIITDTDVSWREARRISQAINNMMYEGDNIQAIYRRIQAETANLLSETELTKIRTILQQFAVPEARANARYWDNMESTPLYMREFTGRLGELVGSAAAAKRAFGAQTTTEWGSDSRGNSWSRSRYQR